ncbi:MAG: DUF998 domain-containing protein [Candidatus Heimdallarchaeota archaeon]|nr:DUF998 domain-containing protein [Candidatus Heimdallarchaeota archaeon]MBY8993107.1 DUF998 domain-containing protein [Candidatus Heimdallarchaeota archaeon]
MLTKQENPYSEVRVSRFENITFFFRYWREAFLAICLFGSALFLINNLIASFFYKGGSNIDSNYPGYSFMWNYVSDLGRVISISGETNLVSRAIFTATLTIVGLSALGYSSVFSNFYKETSLSKLGTAILVFGILNGLDYIVIGFLPLDTHFTQHNAFVIVAFGLKLVLLVLFITIIFKDEKYPYRYAFIYLAYLVVFITFAFFLVFSLNGLLVPYLPTSILGQKLTFYLEAVLYIIQTIGAYIYMKNNPQNISVSSKI